MQIPARSAESVACNQDKFYYKRTGEWVDGGTAVSLSFSKLWWKIWSKHTNLSAEMIDTWKSQMSSHSTTRLPFTTCVFPIHIIEHAACFRSRCDNRADLWIALISFVALFHELHVNSCVQFIATAIWWHGLVSICLITIDGSRLIRRH